MSEHIVTLLGIGLTLMALILGVCLVSIGYMIGRYTSIDLFEEMKK